MANQKKLKQLAVTTANNVADLPLDVQIQAVHDGLATRASAEAQVKEHRIKCVDILHKFGVDLHGKALQPEQLEEVLSNIVVYKEPKLYPELVKQLSKTAGYDLVRMLNNADEAPLIKAFGKKGFAFLQSVAEYRENDGRKDVDVKATKKARDEFTTEFNAFRSALTTYEGAKTTIDNINEYLGIVEKISNIGTNRGKGTRA